MRWYENIFIIFLTWFIYLVYLCPSLFTSPGGLWIHFAFFGVQCRPCEGGQHSDGFLEPKGRGPDAVFGAGVANGQRGIIISSQHSEIAKEAIYSGWAVAIYPQLINVDKWFIHVYPHVSPIIHRVSIIRLKWCSLVVSAVHEKTHRSPVERNQGLSGAAAQ